MPLARDGVSVICTCCTSVLAMCSWRIKSAPSTSFTGSPFRLKFSRSRLFSVGRTPFDAACLAPLRASSPRHQRSSPQGTRNAAASRRYEWVKQEPSRPTSRPSTVQKDTIANSHGMTTFRSAATLVRAMCTRYSWRDIELWCLSVYTAIEEFSGKLCGFLQYFRFCRKV